MKRIIRQDGPKSTDRALVAEKVRQSNLDISDLTEKEAKAICVTDFHDSEYEYSINHWLSRRSLALLEELAEVGIYGEDAAEVGGRFVDQALKQFAQYDVQAEQSFEEHVSEFESPRQRRLRGYDHPLAISPPKKGFHRSEPHIGFAACCPYTRPQSKRTLHEH